MHLRSTQLAENSTCCAAVLLQRAYSGCACLINGMNELCRFLIVIVLLLFAILPDKQQLDLEGATHCTQVAAETHANVTNQWNFTVDPFLLRSLQVVLPARDAPGSLSRNFAEHCPMLKPESWDRGQ